VTGTKRSNPTRTNRAGQRERQVGWEYVHIAIDDATRIAYVEVLPDEKALTAIGFLRRAVKHFDGYGITVERVLTDNGSAYRSTMHAIACRTLGIRHLRARPYRPKTNGKAERSSAPSSAAGPKAPSAATAPNAPPRWPAGPTSTIAADHTAPSATNRPSLASTS
jgi:transposase InsO family protein